MQQEFFVLRLRKSEKTGMAPYAQGGKAPQAQGVRPKAKPVDCEETWGLLSCIFNFFFTYFIVYFMYLNYYDLIYSSVFILFV